MRAFIAILTVLAASAVFAQQQVSCAEMGTRWQQLVKEYKFAELERLADQAAAVCDLDRNLEVFYQSAMTYLWRGELEKARPVVKKVRQKNLEDAEKSWAAPNVGIANTLPLLDALYRGEHDVVEEQMLGYENMIPRSQEVVLAYLLRLNDPRFPAFYQTRKPSKFDMTPILCGVYCKRNSVVKDCPCAGQTMPASQGGPYSIYLEYLDGKPAAELKKTVESRYGEAPLLKKEILQALGL